MRWLLCVVLVSLPSLAGTDECDETFKECREDCSLQYGASIKLENKKKFDKCDRKCLKAHATCSERETELKSNGLDDGALDKSADELDENGMPVSTSSGKGKSASEVPDEGSKRSKLNVEAPPPDVKSRDEDLRDDLPRRSSRSAPVQDEKPLRASKVEQRPREDAPEKPARAAKTDAEDEKPTRAPKAEPVEERPTRAAKSEPVEEKPTRAAKSEPVEEKPTRAANSEPVEERPTRASKAEPVEEKPSRRSEPVEEKPARAAKAEPERPTRTARTEEKPAPKPAPTEESSESEGSSFIPKRRLSKDTESKKLDEEIRD